MNVNAAIAVTEASQVADGRRLAQWLASALDFSEERSGRAALIASELGTNLHKHARSGELLVRRLATEAGDVDGMEIMALDKGPGIPDVALSRRDGYSTTGTLGHGLGAVHRQADDVEIYTHTSGTVVVARLWRKSPQWGVSHPRFRIGAVHVSKAGEVICGDDWAWRMRDDRLALFMADGLGHGLPAREAADAATRVFAAAYESAPGRLIEDVHAALRPTRGAAVASLAIDIERRTATFAGLGNIGALVLHPGGGRHSMVSHNGTAGHTASRIHQFHYPVPPESIVVLFSDGLSTHWDLRAYPGLQQRDPSLIAGVLYRDYSRRRDDVTVVVVRERTPLAEKL
jgi:anti-sigma regulatory factor (Ser/Thr protein kinase)